MRQHFGLSEVQRLTGVSGMTVNNWVARGLVTPSVNLGPGRGRGKQFSFSDLVGLRTIRTLRESGVSLQAVRKVLPRLREFVGQSDNMKALASAKLAVIKAGRKFDVAVVRGESGLVSLLRTPGQSLLALHELSGPVAEVRAALNAKRKAA